MPPGSVTHVARGRWNVTLTDSPDAVEEIYLTYSPLLRRIALRKFGIPLDEVDGLVNDVFTTYLTNPAVVRDVQPYLIGGICNASRDYWRARHREAPLVDAESLEADDSLLDGIPRRMALAATLCRLRTECRELLRRYYFDGEKKEAIAATIGTSPDNVLYRLHICRRRARKVYETLTRVR